MLGDERLWVVVTVTFFAHKWVSVLIVYQDHDFIVLVFYVPDKALKVLHY